METEDSADDVFTSSNAQGDKAMNQPGHASNDNRNVPSATSEQRHQAGSQHQEDEEVIAGGSSYLPSHPVPLLPPEAPKVPPIPISISDENYHRGNWGTKLEFLATMICQLTPFSMFNFAWYCYRNGGLGMKYCTRKTRKYHAAHLPNEVTPPIEVYLFLDIYDTVATYIPLTMNVIFVVPFIVVLFVFGLPVILMQISLGQFTSTGFLTMWRFSPVLKGVSGCVLLFTVGNLVLLNVLLTETLNYVFATLSNPGNLPWSNCGNAWNTDSCRDPSDVYTPSNFTSSYDQYYRYNVPSTPPAVEYRRFYVEAGSHFQIEFVVCALVGSCLLLQSTLMGIKIVGKLSICCLIASFLLTVILLVRSVSLPGSYVGLQYLFQPDLRKLFTTRVWKDAFLFVSFTLTFTIGTNVTLASHNRFHNNCFLDTAILVMVSIFAPLMLAIAVFCFFGFLAHSENLGIENVAMPGSQLIFEVMPESFLMLPSSNLWTLAWFGLVALNLFSSMIGIIIAITSSVLDLFGWIHSWRHTVPVSLIICLVLLLTSVGGHYLGIEMTVGTIDLGLLHVPFIIVIILALSLVWIYGGYQNFQLLRFGRDIEIMVGFFPAFFKVIFTSLWAVVVPVFLAVAVFYNIVDLTVHGVISVWMWMLFGVSLLILGGGFVFGALHETYQHKHVDTYFTDYFYRAALPLPKWGPALDAHRKYAGYLPSDFTPQPYRLSQGDQHPEAGLQQLQPDTGNTGSTSKDAADPGATLPVTTPLLGLTLCSTETTL